MRIASLRATRVRVPRLARFLPRTAKGETAVNDYVILELRCDGDGTSDDVVGIGEVTCAPRWNGEDPAGTVHLVGDVLDEALQGLDPSAWSTVADRLDACVRNRPFLRAGIEMACLDATGRHHGLSAAALLGGARRTSVATKLVLPARDPELVAAMAADALALGATCLKVKVGVGLDADLARLDAVRRVTVDAVHLTVDANEGWPTDRPAHLARALDDRGIAAVEQPFPRATAAATARFRAASGAAVVADESVWDAADVDAAHRTGAFDVVALYPGKCGGLRRTVRLAHTARDRGLAVTLGSNLELGPGAAALAQVAAVVPELAASIPSDLIGPLYAEHALVTDAGFVRWDGASVPTGPGLGVDLDREALAAYAV